MQMRFLKKLSQSLKMKKGEEIVEKKTGVEKIEREFPKIPKYCIPAQSAGAVFLKAQSFWVRLSIRPHQQAQRREWRKATGGTKTAPTSEHVAGTGSNTLIFPERGGAWSRVFLHATAVARHNRAVW